jgi:putative addiction module component (TIGR02574 family)
MNPSTEKLLDDALRLPAEARAALACQLLDSLETEVDEDAEAAWVREIGRRLKELDSSQAKPVPWAEARRQILSSADAGRD